MHFLDALRIEVGRRFVEQQQSGMHGEHAGQGQTLALAAGQSACGAVKFHVAESNNVERGTDPAPDLIFRQIQIFTTESGVIAHTFQNRLRVRILQHQSGTSACLTGVHSVNQQLSFKLAFVIAAEHAGKTGHQRRFSSAGSTQQQHALPWLYGEIHMP